MIQANEVSSTNKTTLSEIDESKKQNYLEEARRWMLTDTKVYEVWDLAATTMMEWWMERSIGKQWLKVNLTEAQTKRIDKADSTFLSNDIVKEFESASSQKLVHYYHHWKLITEHET